MRRVQPNMKNEVVGALVSWQDTRVEAGGCTASHSLLRNFREARDVPERAMSMTALSK